MQKTLETRVFVVLSNFGYKPWLPLLFGVEVANMSSFEIVKIKKILLSYKISYKISVQEGSIFFPCWIRCKTFAPYAMFSLVDLEIEFVISFIHKKKTSTFASTFWTETFLKT